MSDLINRDPLTIIIAGCIIFIAFVVLCAVVLASDRPGTRLGYGRRSDDREYGFGDGGMEE